MVDSKDGSSTIEETEVNSEFEEVLEAFNEMHEEAQRLVILNNKLRSDLKNAISLNWLQHKVSLINLGKKVKSCFKL